MFIGRLPSRRPHWSLALLLASDDQTRGPAGPSNLTDSTEAHTLALFLHGHGNIIIQEIEMKILFRVIHKPKATNSSRLHLGSFRTQGDEFLAPAFRVISYPRRPAPVWGWLPTQGDELTRPIWLLVDKQRLPRSMLSALQGSTIIGVHATCQAAAGSRMPQDLYWDRRRHRRSSWR